MRTLAALIALSAAFWSGCGKSTPAGAADGKSHMHQDVPPHGGTPVPLGDDYNLELVRDEGAGTLSAYVLDDEMEDFIRSSTPSITIVANAAGAVQTLVLQAVANPATGEKVGDTSLFEGPVDWSRLGARFQGTLQAITVRGTTFTRVQFQFPETAAPAP
jgi:hypothetical protein